jgi:hypothetical protein
MDDDNRHMSQAPDVRVRISRIGVRVLAAGMLVVSVVAVASIITHLPWHSGSSSSTTPSPVTGTPDPWGASQAGYREIDAPVGTALRNLPVKLKLPAAAGRPAGVYRAAKSVRVRYVGGSRYGVYLLTVWAPGSGLGPQAIARMAKSCHACTHNRLVRLAPGVSAAIEAGGGGPSIVTWRQGRRTFEVRGPAGSFTNRKAVAAARAIAQANA